MKEELRELVRRRREGDESVLPPSGVCAYWVKTKGRWCNLQPQDGCRFCNTHVLDDRIACPIDPSHSIARSKLASHLKICQKQKEKNEIELASFFQENINAGGAGDKKTHVQTAPVDMNFFLSSSDSGVIFEKKKIWPTHAERHTEQAVSIVRLIPRHIAENAVFIDVGSGRGCLAAAVRSLYPNAPLLLIDHDARRNKFDRHLRRSDFSRIKCDLKDLNLQGIPFLQEKTKIVAIAKHLCGAATDYALKAITSFHGRISAIAIATCCHHRCHWDQYVGRDYLPTPSYFHSAVKYAPWSNIEEKHSPHQNHQERLSSQEREEESATHNDDLFVLGDNTTSRFSKCILGRRCKHVIDRGRLEYLRNFGYNVRLEPYCPTSISPENSCLLAVKE